MGGALLIAASWIIYSWANTLGGLYTGGIVGGIGTGLVYGTCIGNAVKWFEKRRGLAAGFTAAGFGAGAALTILPLTHSLATAGYQATFFNFALIQGGVVLLAALLLKKPPKGAGGPEGQRAIDTFRHGQHAVANASQRGLLGDVRRFRAGGRERPHGDCPACSDRERVWNREYSGYASRFHDSGADVRPFAQQPDERPQSAAVRLDVGLGGARDDDVPDVPGEGNRDSLPEQVWERSRLCL